jgi:hypothetical protein
MPMLRIFEMGIVLTMLHLVTFCPRYPQQKGGEYARDGVGLQEEKKLG